MTIETGGLLCLWSPRYSAAKQEQI